VNQRDEEVTATTFRSSLVWQVAQVSETQVGADVANYRGYNRKYLRSSATFALIRVPDRSGHCQARSNAFVNGISAPRFRGSA
jgi:hypothetical protein